MLMLPLMHQRHCSQAQVLRGMRFELPRRNWKNSLTSKRSTSSWAEGRESSKAAGGTVLLGWTTQTQKTHQCSTENRRKKKISSNLKRTRSIIPDFKVSYLFHYHFLIHILNSFRAESHHGYLHSDPSWNRIVQENKKPTLEQARKINRY